MARQTAKRVRVTLRSGQSPVFLLIGAGFAALLSYAVLYPWTDKLAFPFYRGMMALVAIGLWYFLLRVGVNATELFVEDDALQIRHGPLPPTRAQAVPLAQIERLGYEPLRGPHALLRDGTSVRLCEECSDQELPARVARELGLDVPVS